MSHIDEFFMWVFRTSWQTSVLIGFILIVQWVFRSHLSARWRHALWLLVVVRMMLPSLPESRLSVFNLPSWLPHTVQKTSYALPAESPASLTTAPSGVYTAPSARRPHTHFYATTTFWKKFALWCWLGGVVFLSIRLIVGTVRLSWRTAQRHVVTDSALLELLEKCRETIGVRTHLHVIETPDISSAALMGFLRPKLLLPQNTVQTLSRSELRYVFLHELAHVKRWDIATNWLMQVFQILHWFNPLVWLAFAHSRADRELACDALVLLRTQENEIENYGRTILKALKLFSAPSLVPSVVGIAENKNQIKERITMIAQFNRKSYRRSFVAVLLLSVLAVLTLTTAQSQNADNGTKPAVTDADNAVSVTTKLEDKLKTIILPKVSFREASLTDVARFLANESRKLDPDKVGVKIVIGGDTTTRQITLELYDVPMFQLLSYVTAVTGRKMRIKNNAVVLLPADTAQSQNADNGTKPAVTDADNAVSVTTKLADKLKTIIFPEVSFREASLTDVARFLANESRKLDPDKVGVKIVIGGDTTTRQITLELYKIPMSELLKCVTQLNGLKMRIENNAVVLLPADTAQSQNADNGTKPAVTDADNAVSVTTKLEDKLKTIIFPEVSFREVSIVDVVQFLFEKSRELDPDKVGVSIVLSDAAKAAARPITSHFTNVQMNEMLKHVTTSAGVRMRIDKNAVVILPANAE